MMHTTTTTTTTTSLNFKPSKTRCIQQQQASIPSSRPQLVCRNKLVLNTAKRSFKTGAGIYDNGKTEWDVNVNKNMTAVCVRKHIVQTCHLGTEELG